MEAAEARPAKRSRLQAAQARFSERSIWIMQRLLNNKDATKGPSGAAKRAFNAALAPARQCFQILRCPNIDPAVEDIQFAVARIPQLLRYTCDACEPLRQILHAHAQRGPVKVILCHDETTAGNVLATEARQKVLMFYITFACLQDFQNSASAWFPVGAVTHDQLSHCRGGLSKVHALFVEQWCAQNLDTPFAIGSDTLIRLQLSVFVSDMESQRAALCAKGSAGLKPCAFCITCLAKDASETAEDGSFQTIAQSDLSLFAKHDHGALQRYMREHVPNIPHTTKKDKELREKCLGYRITADGMWTSDPCCNTLPLQAFVNDSMHLYYANGIVCTEIQLLLTEVHKVTGKTIDDIKQTVLDAGWERPKHAKKDGENKWWCQRLFKTTFFTGSMYKGSAAQTRALAPLLAWLAEHVWLHIVPLRHAALSFLALSRCLHCLQTLPTTRDFELLRRLQREHHDCFRAVWPEHLRPKHHHRLHLSDHYLTAGCIPSCWGPESKHRDYKGLFAANTQHLLTSVDGGVQFSWHLLPRLLNRHAEMLSGSSISLKGWSLENPFSQEQVFQETNIRDCNIASSCTVGVLRLMEGDIILWGRNVEHAACCRFFLEQAGQLFIYITPLRLQSNTETYKTFAKGEKNDVVKWSALLAPRSCSWWRDTGNHILCVP
eukprot:Skav205348  [mRNA]  locus=scaffold418:36848:38836:+ [translate_table: standard]